MEKMLVTQGLNELKTLDSRITREIMNSVFVGSAKTCDKNITPGYSKVDFNSKAKSSWDSIQSLIDRRELIKAAIVESNANTLVDVCGEKMSVAKAIDLKNSINYKKILLSTMKSQFADAIGVMSRANAKMESQIDNLVETSFGAKDGKTSIKESDYEAIAKPYREHNEVSLVDPLDIEKQIEAPETYIDEFTATIDQVLQISNCITTIEF